MLRLLRCIARTSLAALVAAGCGRRADAPAVEADTGLAAATVLAAPPTAILPESLAVRLGNVSLRAETSLAGYNVRCYRDNDDPPVQRGVAVFDGSTLVWRFGRQSEPNVDMDAGDTAVCPFGPDFRSRAPEPPFGTDLNRDGAPDIVVKITDKDACEACAGVMILSLSRPFRADLIGYTDSVGFRTVAGDSVLIAMTDVSMNELEGDYASQIRPVAVYAWRGGRWTLAPDRMRTPRPDSLTLDAEAARLRALDPDDRYFALSDAMARLVAGGHEDDAWGLMRRVRPDSEQAVFRRSFRSAVLESSLRSLLKP